MSSTPTGHRGLRADDWMRFVSGPYEAHTPQGDAHAIGMLDTRLCRDSGDLALLATMVIDGANDTTTRRCAESIAKAVLARIEAETAICARWKGESDKEDRLEARADAEEREWKGEA